MTIGAVFDFFINQFVSIVAWFYNLQLPITDNVSIPFGSFLLSFVALAICVRIFMYFNEFNLVDNVDVVTKHYDDGTTIKYINHNGKEKYINYYDR